MHTMSSQHNAIQPLYLWKVVGPAGAQETHLSASTDSGALFTTRVASILISELRSELASLDNMQEFTGMSCMDAGTWTEVNNYLLGLARTMTGLPSVVVLGKIKVTKHM